MSIPYVQQAVEVEQLWAECRARHADLVMLADPNESWRVPDRDNLVALLARTVSAQLNLNRFGKDGWEPTE